MNFSNLVSFGISLIGVFIITWGAIVTTIDLFKSGKNKKTTRSKASIKNKIRHGLAAYILLGLEYMIAGDIIHTVLYPSKESLIVLGAIVAIRTVISFFLNQELKNT